MPDQPETLEVAMERLMSEGWSPMLDTAHRSGGWIAELCSCDSSKRFTGAGYTALAALQAAEAKRIKQELGDG